MDLNFKINKVLKTNRIFEERSFLYRYNDNSFRISLIKSCKNSGLIDTSKNSIKFNDPFFIPKTEDEELERISLSRTKKNIREISLCNDFDYFATLTINSSLCDRFSLSSCQVKLKKICHSIKRKNKSFKFLFITEKHKDGAFHFHGLVKSIDVYTNVNGYYSNKDFDKLGFNSFSKIKDYNKCCNYILKYITKDCIRNENNQIYICSRGLKKADRTEIKLDFEVPFKFENDFCKIYDFSPDEIKDPKLMLKIMELKEL